MIVSDILKELGTDLKNFANSDIVFGEPIELEGTKIVPMCKLSVGYGGGGGGGERSAGCECSEVVLKEELKWNQLP